MRCGCDDMGVLFLFSGTRGAQASDRQKGDESHCWRALDIRCRRATLCTAASQKLQDLQEIADAIWAMAETGSQMPDVFEALYTAADQKLQHYSALETANHGVTSCSGIAARHTKL